jgi:putative transport protein
MGWLGKALQGMPELVLLFTVAVGYALGSIKLGRFCLGTATAALIAGLLIGQAGVEIDRELRWGLFYLFLFANGYAAGPQFFRALQRDGARPILLSITVTITGLATAYAMARLLRLDPGISAGLLSGSLTQSSAIGTATDAIMNLALPLDQRRLLVSHIAVADALTYVFGAVGMITFVSIIAPRLLGIDLRQEAAALDAQLGIKPQTPGVSSAYRKYAVRAYRLTDSAFIGRTVSAAERNEQHLRYFIERVHRGGSLLGAGPDTVLERGDVVLLAARSDCLLGVGARFGPEVHDPQLLDLPIEVLSVVVTNRRLCGPTLDELAASQTFDFHGIGLLRLTRAGQEIPLSPGITIDRGDVLELIGPQRAVECAARAIGYALHPTNITSLSTVGFGILAGAVCGMPFFMAGNVKITLSVSVGVLVGGLLCGWIGSLRPAFGRIPQPALQFMIDFGLAAFVAGAGLQAGPHFVHAVEDLGATLLLAGVVVTLIPQAAALLVGRYVLRMNPLLLLGGLAGAQTFTAALAAVQENAGSRTAVLGYTVPYAISNILLTLSGTLIVALVAN